MTELASVEIVEVADPTPGADDVVVAVAAVGICGTDVHVLLGEHGRRPVVPGHEMAGTVVAAGSEVSAVRVGDRVAVDPNLPCGVCALCSRGRGNLCPNLRALGVTEPGGAAEFMVAPAANCVRLSDHVDLATAALIEPLSCAVHACDVAGTDPGSSVLIFGAGTLGLMMAELARHAGAARVDVVEPNEERRQRANRLGCMATAPSADRLEGPEWDLVIDATGNAAAIQDGLGRVATGGTFLQLGVTSPGTTVTVAPYEIYRREISIVGSMAVLRSFDRAADLLAAGVIDAQELVTATFALDDYAGALDAFRAGRGLKTLVSPAITL